MNILFLSGFLTGLAFGAFMSRVFGEATTGVAVGALILAAIYGFIAIISK